MKTQYVDDGASKENLHFDDKSKQVAFLFFGAESMFSFFNFYPFIETLVKVWENSKKL